MTKELLERAVPTDNGLFLENGHVQSLSWSAINNRFGISGVIRIRKEDFNHLPESGRFTHFNLEYSGHQPGARYALLAIETPGYFRSERDFREPVLSLERPRFARCLDIAERVMYDAVKPELFQWSLPNVRSRSALEQTILHRYRQSLPDVNSKDLLERGVSITTLDIELVKNMKLLAIETSCDETAAAVIESDGRSVGVRSSTVSSQAELHAAWGGVVPNLAAREHVKNIIPIVESALRGASVAPEDIDCIAVTQGPGLIPALLVGVSAAKTLALAWKKPLLGVNHLEGHIYANLFTPGAELRFPLLALIVSGGHTQLILMRDHFEYELLGETDDDAAGEAFDKVAKMLNLPYPGGPEIGKRADAYRIEHPDMKASRFPRPMLSTNDYRFSFSGLKTAVLYSLQKETAETLTRPEFIALIAHEFQEAVVDTLVGKTERALQEYQPKTLVIAGGVSANARLRERMELMVAGYPDCQFLMPPFQYSLDNAAMIGAAGILRYARMNEAECAQLISNATSLEPSAHFPLAS